MSDPISETSVGSIAKKSDVDKTSVRCRKDVMDKERCRIMTVAPLLVRSPSDVYGAALRSSDCGVVRARPIGVERRVSDKVSWSVHDTRR